MELSNRNRANRKRNPDGAVTYNNNPNPNACKSNGDTIKIRKIDGGVREMEAHQRPVNDAEVEEFFAIMRRMANSRRAAAASVRDNGVRWSPAFIWEDFYGGVQDDGEEKEEMEELEEEKKGLDLDLNEDPEPEGAAPVSQS